MTIPETIPSAATRHCPHCGTDVTTEPVTEYGIFCPAGCGDFWESETMPGNTLHLYRHSRHFNMMLKKETA